MKAFALIRETGRDMLGMELRSAQRGSFFYSPYQGQPERFEVVQSWQGQAARAAAVDYVDASELPAVRQSTSHTQSLYESLVEKARRACEEGALEKVVLSRCQSYPSSDLDPLDTFDRLCASYPGATVYLIQREGQTLWMGATPECLVSMEGQSLHTMSLAGTRVSGGSGAWGAKEREEQHLVTRDIIHMLQVLGCKELTVEGPTVLPAGPVEHLCSMIHGERNGSAPEEIAAALHPTPAVGGLPRAQAATFIRQREGYDRRFYSGYFGWSEPHRSAFYVNLRCSEWGQDSVLCYAGGGITSKSDAHQEWLETEQKLKTLERVIFG
ncbi:MAG TPA: isochorismate synthase [Cryomorphaceae bacterium]|nr:isochorismate synthase [Cryomorphaceae bacterium]